MTCRAMGLEMLPSPRKLSPLPSFLGTILLAMVLWAGVNCRAEALTVIPPTLTFDARLDDPVLLTLEVRLDSPKAKLTVELEGFHCDRKITALNDGRYRIEIAPDTGYAGSLDGQIKLESDGVKVGEPITISGRVRPWIAIRPTRLFMGQIGKGPTFSEPQTRSVLLTSDNQPFDIRSVDFGDIPGGSWHSDPKPGAPALTRTVRLSFSGDALAAGVPYGALAKKAIIIHTSQPQATDLIIPVEGLISVNTTGRDYAQYQYNGQLRWEGHWPTPNFAAAFLATGLVLLCGLGGTAHERLSKRMYWQVALATVILPMTAAGCRYLTLTYSRGGWFALAAGSAILLIGRTGCRWYGMALALIFAVTIGIQPRGPSRVASSVEIAQDKSVEHRLLVWKGALQMMAEHPWSGVGRGRFGDVFATDYRLPTHTDDYNTAVNDFLTFGAERGIPLLTAALTGSIGLLVAAVWIGRCERNAILLGCGAAMTCYLVSCWFSSIAFYWSSSSLFIGAVAGVLITLLWREFRMGRRGLTKRMGHYAAKIASAFALLGAVCRIAGVVSLRSLPDVTPIRLGGISGLEVSPRWSAVKGTIFYIGDAGQTPESLLASTLRPLATKGWSVLCFEQPEFTSDAYEGLLQTLEAGRKTGLLRNRWFMAGHQRGAQLVLALAAKSHPTAVGCYMTPYQSAFEELSPLIQIKQIQEPLLLCAQRTDALRSAQRLSQLVAAESVYGRLNTTHEIHPADFSYASPRWQRWINALDRFDTYLIAQ